MTDLDRRIAEAMGWEDFDKVWGRVWKKSDGTYDYMVDDREYDDPPRWHPSTSWDQAGVVVEWMRERGWRLKLDGPFGITKTWHAAFSAEDPEERWGVWFDEAPTAPEAIVRAALKALEGE